MLVQSRTESLLRTYLPRGLNMQYHCALTYRPGISKDRGTSLNIDQNRRTCEGVIACEVTSSIMSYHSRDQLTQHHETRTAMHLQSSPHHEGYSDLTLSNVLRPSIHMRVPLLNWLSIIITPNTHIRKAH